MLTTNDVAKVVDTILSIPGMNETVKIDLKVSRKNVLLLNQVIVRGLSSETGDKNVGVLAEIPKEILEDLKEIADEILEKGGLTDLNERLNSLTTGK